MILRVVGPAIALVAVVGAGCSDINPTVCLEQPVPHFQPSDTTILAGQSFTASVRISSCGGGLTAVDEYRWQSADPVIATVDSVSGRVVGRAPGATRIHARGQSYGPAGSLAVAVQ